MLPGLLSFCPVLASLPKGAGALKFARCALTQKSVNKLAESLINNSYMLTSLRDLDLSGNNLKDDITVGLGCWAPCWSCMVTLDVGLGHQVQCM